MSQDQVLLSAKEKLQKRNLVTRAAMQQAFQAHLMVHFTR